MCSPCRKHRGLPIRRAFLVLLVAAASTLWAGCSTVGRPNTPAADQSVQAKKKEPSFWEKWFGPKEPEKPKTVNQWLRDTKPVRLDENGGK